MKIHQAIHILQTYQEWRLGKTDDYPVTPKELSEAIEMAIEVMTRAVC